MAAMAMSTLALSARGNGWWWSWPYNTFLFWEREEVLIMPIHTPASSEKQEWVVVVMARYHLPILGKGTRA